MAARKSQPRSFSRGDRVAEQVRRELADLLMFEVRDPRVKLVSLTEVEITPDYAHAKVFYTVMPGQNPDDISSVLSRAAGYLRANLGKRLSVHTIPELHFVYDSSIERGATLSALIDKAAEESRKNEAEGE